MHPSIQEARNIILELESTLRTTIIGQDEVLRKLIIAYIAGGHVLLEGVPGLGKTQIIKTLADALGYDTKRISFTPDLMPSDLTGIEIYRPQTGEFEVRKGPIFTHLLLADEINRTPPKVQSALLEAMEEHAITIGTTTFSLPDPFFVIATQNPIEHEGTYPLPEAELDRFMMKLIINYPKKSDEISILKARDQYDEKKISRSKKKISSTEISALIKDSIHVDERIYEYVTDILDVSRGNGALAGSKLVQALEYGASTRAGIACIEASRVVALLDGRDHVLPDDVKYIVHDILRHRISPSYEALTAGVSREDIITEILKTVVVP